MNNMLHEPTALPIRNGLRDLRASLLPLHKSLLEHEKIEYERDRGRSVTPGELVRLALGDPWFGWLRKLSEMIVGIDQLLEDDAASMDDGLLMLQTARALFRPGPDETDFLRRYKAALQRDPASVLAHVQVQRALFTDS